MKVHNIIDEAAVDHHKKLKKYSIPGMGLCSNEENVSESLIMHNFL